MIGGALYRCGPKPYAQRFHADIPMAKFYPHITPLLAEFIRRQHLFFTATAATTGRVNLSPKGLDSFRLLGEMQVAYLDLTGSGAETAAHLKADGRMTILFCGFEGEPLILRLYGRGRAVAPSQPEWPTLATHFPDIPGARQIVILDVDAVQTSCGFGVPRYRFEGQREELVKWAEKKGPAGLAAYREEKNRLSIDGLPTGIEPAGPK